jgi:hypothetical protein
VYGPAAERFWNIGRLSRTAADISLPLCRFPWQSSSPAVLAFGLNLLINQSPSVIACIYIGCPTSGVAERAMGEAVPDARGVSKARQL